MRCGLCKKTWLEEKEEPACFNGSCTIGFDRLDRHDKRLLEVRETLALLAEFHMGEHICRLFDVTRDDLRLLTILEDTTQQMKSESEGNHG